MWLKLKNKLYNSANGNGKSGCDKWFGKRKIRITAWKHVQSIKRRRAKTEGDLNNMLRCLSNPYVKAIGYGKVHDNRGKKLYENLNER